MDPPFTLNESRPYRSHKIPACDRCRKRKLRCEADLSNGPCRICREQGADCDRSEASRTRKHTTPNTNNIKVPSVRSLKRYRILDASPSTSLRHKNSFPEDSTAEQSGIQSPDYSRQERSNVNDKSSMIIGPIIAEDDQLLKQSPRSSFAHDVPLPTLKGLLTEGNHEILRIRPAECFIFLCELTEILGDILPLLYDRRCRPITETNKLLRQLETNLDEWEESLPQWATSKSNAEQVSGLSSLRLGFLSVKMLLCRIAFHSATHSPEPCLKEVKAYHQAMLRECAKAITTFLTSLTGHNLNEFWMPYSAYHICSATIILLRCAIDTTDTETVEWCKSSLSEIKQWLGWAHTSHHWDIAEICLAQCAEPNKKRVIIYKTTSRLPSNHTEKEAIFVK
ncbi:hypothetical protein EAF00_008067 [Botryotinia globosa]|nr:hypothetical protein EAF00_008067 [Botryotinia globosa]